MSFGTLVRSFSSAPGTVSGTDERHRVRTTSHTVSKETQTEPERQRRASQVSVPRIQVVASESTTTGPNENEFADEEEAKDAEGEALLHRRLASVVDCSFEDDYLNESPTMRRKSGSFNQCILSSRKSSIDNYASFGRERSRTVDSFVFCRSSTTYQPRAESSKCFLLRTLSTNLTEYENNDFFDEDEMSSIQCFLPTGLLIDVKVRLLDEIFTIKKNVIQAATTDDKIPLRGCMNPDAESYFISFISQAGKMEEVLDERKTLREVQPFENILKFNLRTKVKNSGHYKLRKSVSRLMNQELTSFDEIQNVEVNQFRWRMKAFANKIALERRNRLKYSWSERLLYQCPPLMVVRLSDIDGVPETIKLQVIWTGQKFSSMPKIELDVPSSTTATGLIRLLANDYGIPKDRWSSYCLKALGEETYFIGDKQLLINYAYIYNRVTANEMIKLLVVSFDDVRITEAHRSVYFWLDHDVQKVENCDNPLSDRKLSTSMTHQPIVHSCNLIKTFTVIIETMKLSVDLFGSGSQRHLSIQLGLFHGSKPLCSTVMHNIKELPDESGIIYVNKALQFNFQISNLPRMVKLCMGIYEKKRNNQINYCWINTMVFDYNGKMKGKDTLHMWNYAVDQSPTHGALSPLRPTISNPNINDATDIIISFMSDNSDGIVFYGNDSNIETEMSVSIPSQTNSTSETISSKLYKEELELIASRDPLHDTTVQEKDLIWKVREVCRHHLPHLLPRIIDCVDYGKPEEVKELHRLIETWPLMAAEKILQLLDYAYPDPVVRSYAVKCLRSAKDSEILMFLLQLVQALKHENYLQCNLVEFLLERALNNQHIGHFLFWELRAEMNSPSVGLLYALVLEAYLIAAPEHLKVLEPQVSFLSKCHSTHSASVKKESSGSIEKDWFQSSLKSQFYGAHPFKNFINPLKPSEKCRKLIASRCRRMNSKKRPQVLSFENNDVQVYEDASQDLEDIRIMFKIGDDLRQDRLTLQLLSLMDNIWKEAGLDFRMNIYGVITTGPKEGFIEIVQQAETICQIQLSQTESKTTAVFKKELLLSWLKSHNNTPEALRQAQREFTLSCAGYTVAAYVLGIGDRHNDNIMVKKNGQLFHVDFGHFLGNFKYKFGIKRERVRLILYQDFVEVIKADIGIEGNFERFRELCEKAFLTIRNHGSLIISLLAMMISTGLPELSSEQDLNTIRSNLHLDRSQKEALDCFKKDFSDSLKDAWKISVDWWFHSLNQIRSKPDSKN